jgi:uncharacterized membrane protein
MSSGEIRDGTEFTLLTRRSYSLSPGGRLLVFGTLAAVTLAISLGFAIKGAWPVLPFAGLECVALFLVWRWLCRHEGDYECVTIDSGRITVESRIGGRLTRREFDRAWARVIVETADGLRPSVFLRSHGKSIEVARLLGDEAKIEAARRLRQKISENHS